MIFRFVIYHYLARTGSSLPQGPARRASRFQDRRGDFQGLRLIKGIARKWRKQMIRMLRFRRNEQISAVGGIEGIGSQPICRSTVFLCTSLSIVSLRLGSRCCQGYKILRQITESAKINRFSSFSPYKKHYTFYIYSLRFQFFHKISRSFIC